MGVLLRRHHEGGRSELVGGKHLLHAVPEANPLAGFWTLSANDYLWLIDPSNAWGPTLIGLALLADGFVRFAVFWGSVVVLFYRASVCRSITRS